MIMLLIIPLILVLMSSVAYAESPQKLPPSVQSQGTPISPVKNLSSMILGFVALPVVVGYYGYKIVFPDRLGINLDKTDSYLGEDKNKNNVRDDVEHYINQTFIQPEMKAFAMNHYALNTQLYSAQSYDQEKVMFSEILNCHIRYKEKYPTESEKLTKFMNASDHIFFNTHYRKKINEKYKVGMRTGSTFSLDTDGHIDCGKYAKFPASGLKKSYPIANFVK
ncbi:hypothetical protein B9T29_11740 [Acinetobacter sp. ANC 3903]|jgi:hypothetical protein|nr:hypothetical protein B9T29_11740 [Acinetobacter sp. ANC 3903]